MQGEPIRGHVHSTDASSGAEIPIFKMGSNSAHTLNPDEYIEIHQIELVTVAGGDCAVILDSDDGNDIDTGEIVLRGTFAANGGIEKMMPVPAAGTAGAKPHVIAPAGVVDVTFVGTLRRDGDDGEKQSWREADLGS